MCVVCDTMGCCDAREQHTYTGDCLCSATSKIRNELEKVLEAVKALQKNPGDSAAKRFIRNHLTADGHLVIGNQTLVGDMMTEE